jgi:hypothetical protein
VFSGQEHSSNAQGGICSIPMPLQAASTASTVWVMNVSIRLIIMPCPLLLISVRGKLSHRSIITYRHGRPRARFRQSIPGLGDPDWFRMLQCDHHCPRLSLSYSHLRQAMTKILFYLVTQLYSTSLFLFFFFLMFSFVRSGLVVEPCLKAVTSTGQSQQLRLFRLARVIMLLAYCFLF